MTSVLNDKTKTILNLLYSSNELNELYQKLVEVFGKPENINIKNISDNQLINWVITQRILWE